MKEHESRRIKPGERYKFYNDVYKKIDSGLYDFSDKYKDYVDSNNFLHNLEGKAWYGGIMEYWIHGKNYEKKEWEIERNRLLMLEDV